MDFYFCCDKYFSIFKYTKLIINKKKIGLISDPFLIASILSIIFLQFRILFENSYSVFSVDLLIFCSSYLIINNKYKEIKLKKKKLYIWFSDLKTSSGEGILGKNF